MLPNVVARAVESTVCVDLGKIALIGELTIPEGAEAIVLFANGLGCNRHNARSRFVAARLHAACLATLLIDLLTEEEEYVERRTTRLRFDLDLLTGRLISITNELDEDRRTAGLAIGYLGASIGSGAALTAAAQLPDRVGAVVSRGGRPDLAGNSLEHVRAATLLIVGGAEAPVVAWNYDALVHLGAADKKLIVVPNATHLFEAPGQFNEVAELAAVWFSRHLKVARHEPRREIRKPG